MIMCETKHSFCLWLGMIVTRVCHAKIPTTFSFDLKITNTISIILSYIWRKKKRGGGGGLLVIEHKLRRFCLTFTRHTHKDNGPKEETL